MTAMSPMLTAGKEITGTVTRMKMSAMDRDMDMDRVRLVREGRFADVWPDQFSEAYPTALVANFVDVSVRDLASNLAPLPSLACSAGQMKTDADKRRAAAKNRIGSSYWRDSELQMQMKNGADQYLTYGFLPVWVEADFDCNRPFIHVEDPAGAYYELDRKFCTKQYARVWRDDKYKVAAEWPEYEQTILYDKYNQEWSSPDIEVVRYIDDMQVIIYLPERGNLIVGQYMHRMPYCPVHIAQRPGLTSDPRGQFDDVLWVQLAAAVMAALTIEAAHKAVQAPIAMPLDVVEFNIGPDAIVQSDTPEKIGRVGLEVPQAAFALGEQLKEEMKEGAGYPGTRLGQAAASQVTGRGVGALEGGFDSQIALGQDIIGRILKKATQTAFEMDALIFATVTKTINGTLSGESFELTYTPGKDIGTNFECDVSYGFAAGANPAGSIVTMLQLRGDEVISRDTFRRNLPLDVDVEHEQEMIDIQGLEDGLKQGLQAALQSAGQMIAQGQTAEAMQFFQATAAIIAGRREGKDFAILVNDTFTQLQQQQQAAAQAAQAAAQAQAGAAGGGDPNDPTAGAPDAGDPLAGVGPTGLPPGVAPGQAGMPPGGRPGITDLTAGFTGSGQPQEGATIQRRLALG